jgi:hypothetical protein
MVEELDKNKKVFLKYQLLDAAWTASTSRGNIYLPGISSDEKKEFRKQVEDRVLSFLDGHMELLSVKELESEIEDLSKSFSDRYMVNFRIGQSQKILNLMLKYYWVLGWIHYIPPHCPIDRIILKAGKAKINGKLPIWTKMNRIEDYRNCLAAIKKNKNVKCLSSWELETYNKVEVNK